MKVRITLNVNLELADILEKLGAYRRAKFTREALLHFIKSPQGQRLLNELVADRQSKNLKDKQSETINLDELI